ncbi:MAG TPA: twin-arginine translocase TatA/TatE family subunit [Solirubrobacteraceae bacterium]|jgi:sec-independent protein translocase protein TatA
MASGILSPTHLLVVLLVALIVLGPKRLPSAGKALGQGIREFKDSITGTGHDEEPAQLPAASIFGGATMQSPEPVAVAQESVTATHAEVA